MISSSCPTTRVFWIIWDSVGINRGYLVVDITSYQEKSPFLNLGFGWSTISDLVTLILDTIAFFNCLCVVFLPSPSVWGRHFLFASSCLSKMKLWFPCLSEIKHIQRLAKVGLHLWVLKIAYSCIFIYQLLYYLLIWSVLLLLLFLCHILMI